MELENAFKSDIASINVVEPTENHPVETARTVPTVLVDGMTTPAALEVD
jgi:hypothetical protein